MSVLGPDASKTASEVADISWAFPFALKLPGHTVHSPGMSLRDWFAGQALIAATSSFFVNGEAWDDYDDLAASVYMIADAMLKAREAKP